MIGGGVTVTMRLLIRGFDALFRRAIGVFEFCAGADCLLRLQAARAPHSRSLSDGTEVRSGDRVLRLHLWNEHVPPMGQAGPDIVWAARVRRMLFGSLRAVAEWMANEPRAAGVRAVGGVTVLIGFGGAQGGPRLMRRIGFDVFPYRSPLGRFGEFWQNVYTWGLMWAFNAASLRHRRLLHLRRVEIWMSAPEFLRRYGG